MPFEITPIISKGFFFPPSIVEKRAFFRMSDLPQKTPVQTALENTPQPVEKWARIVRNAFRVSLSVPNAL